MFPLLTLYECSINYISSILVNMIGCVCMCVLLRLFRTIRTMQYGKFSQRIGESYLNYTGWVGIYALLKLEFYKPG